MAVECRAREGSGAIVCLTRGYSDIRGYALLMARNRSIYETINRRRRKQYPLLIWHEGNIKPAHRRHILARERNADVRFVDISAAFRLPRGVLPERFRENWSAGYRLMCRFHSYQIWRYTREFEYVMRLDEDCILRSVGADPIDWLGRSDADFAAPIFVPETHALTNRTLKPFVRAFARSAFPGARGSFYDQQFPYTSFYVARTGFWRRAPVQRFLRAVTRECNFLNCRWGDLPVLGVALNMFAEPGKVALLPGVTYTHGSHGVTIVGTSELVRW